MKIRPIILAGGSGSRLWPSSRARHPKQFLNMHGDHTMLQATLKRLDGLEIESSVILCNEEHRFLVAEQLREIDRLGMIILEPEGKNTAPAVALAALASQDEALLLVLPADHVIQNEGEFKAAVVAAIPLAKAGKLVTFGIIPSEPHTEYGYIKRGQKYGDGFVVDQFVEKPGAIDAQKYVESDAYYWNSGMFLIKAGRYLEELKKFRPDIFAACESSMQDTTHDLDFTRINKQAFSSCPSESIDYAVLEVTSDAVVVPMQAGWNDIGSWSSLWDISEKDKDGNVNYGDVLLHNSQNCYIKTDKALVAAVGVDDLIIISTKDVVMVAHRKSAQDAKIIATKLKDDGRSEWDIHREVFRPWGKFDSLDVGDRYQVKRITVKPGAKLSVQSHEHRAEHWVVVSGTARVTNGDKTFLLSENESTYIPKGVIHALENPRKVNLELIEVQSGDYLGEDDIVRYEDNYGRSQI